jgi:predicted RNase H-like nuclease
MGHRHADAASAALLGPRRSSVFPTPPRLVLLEESFAAANARHREFTLKGMSQQTYALRTRLLEADSLYGDESLRLYEVHPEVSFTMMGGGPPAMSRKPGTDSATAWRAWRPMALRSRPT